MRTNIDINNELMVKAKKLSGLSTKKAVVEEALVTYIRIKNQSQIRTIKGKVQWEGDLNTLRK